MSPEEEQRVYEDHVLPHFEQPYHRGPLALATHRHRIDNPLCGDSVRIELLVNAGGIIEQAWFTGAGCIISQSAASMLVQHCEQKSVDAMLEFSAFDMLRLFRARLTARRQQCCFLANQALRAAIELPRTMSAKP